MAKVTREEAETLGKNLTELIFRDLDDVIEEHRRKQAGFLKNRKYALAGFEAELIATVERCMEIVERTNKQLPWLLRTWGDEDDTPDYDTAVL